MKKITMLFLVLWANFTYAQEASIIENLMQENNVPALAIAILKNGKFSQIKVQGNLYNDHIAPRDAVFNVASLTKPVVAMLTLKLVEQGKWNLDEPVHRYWIDPDLEEDPNIEKLTTRHILTHQTGFSNWRWQNGDGKLKFNFEPGIGYGYSGEGFEYLKKVLESRFDQPLDKLADSLIFEPLEMNNTHFKWNVAIDEDKFARWHDSDGKLYSQDYKIKSVSAADDLMTTIDDYGKFAEYVLEKIAGQHPLYQEMVKQGNGQDNNTVIGLGWELLPELKGDEYALLHTGGDYGVNTLIILLPETGEGLIIFTNGDNGNMLYFDLVNRYLSLGSEINRSAQ
ncbi:MAG: beta-lactamase family protein [Gramella sp.]|nr:beta-lactamase family protein [Christiangramia sp.]